MKVFSTIAVLFFCLVSVQAQDEELIDYSSSDFGFKECGSRLAESQTYGYTLPSVKVVKIVDANSIIVEKSSEKNKTKKYSVNLIGINPNTNKSNIEKFLEENLLNQLVNITGNKWKSGAIVSFYDKEGRNPTEVNFYLLGKGIAEYQEFDSEYIVPSRTPCVYQKAEETAKEEKLGIWAK